jgi:hypothetical protein
MLLEFDVAVNHLVDRHALKATGSLRDGLTSKLFRNRIVELNKLLVLLQKTKAAESDRCRPSSCKGQCLAFK